MSISSHNRLLGCLILVVSGSAMAELPPILISGARTSAPGLDIPAATTTITREEIAETGARDLDEVLRQIPALHVSDGLGNGGNSRIDMRGFGATAPSNVAILIDGRKINPATDSGSLYLNSIDLSNVDQIEIIEGSAGTLFGNQAVGGLVNIITRRPRARSARLQLGGGSYEAREFTASVSEPFASGALRVGVSHRASDNYRDHNASRVTRLDGRADFGSAGGHSHVDLQVLDDYLETPGALLADLASIEVTADGASTTANLPRGHRWRHQTSRRKSIAPSTAATTSDTSRIPEGTGFSVVSKTRSTQTMAAKPRMASQGPCRTTQFGGGRFPLRALFDRRAAEESGQMVHHTGPARKNSAKTAQNGSSPAGRQLFFNSSRPLAAEGGRRRERLWVVERDGGGWSSPRALPPAINADHLHWSCTVDGDGNVFINDAQVIITDIEASNGVIHVIDKVLIPGEKVGR